MSVDPEEKIYIFDHANVWNVALDVLLQNRFEIRCFERLDDDDVPNGQIFWEAQRSNTTVRAFDPVSLIGLARIAEVRGAAWSETNPDHFRRFLDTAPPYPG